ncbi:MAG: YigZ family protein [Eubacteriaceae bacterium]|jgi:uncharacterized YigZ family protein|nr:YigZ family protein [Eubacteriaceae bacterium]MDD4507334.1 YigZ family protein [Eubacteriaceae bacterium]
MKPDYLTITGFSESEARIKKSRFIGQAYPITSEEQAETLLATMRKTHYKANHICWAYILSTTPARQKASDDGEPSGTAGKPILEVLERRELKDVLVLVIRYFGGIKLGAGGLIRAYSGSASAVLDTATVVRETLADCVRLTIDYPQYGNLKNKLTDRNVSPCNESFAEKVTLDFEIPISETQGFLNFIQEETNDRFTSEIKAQKRIAIPVYATL